MLLQLPFYNKTVNLVWCGLSAGLLLSVGLLAAIMFGQSSGTVDPEVFTWVSTCCDRALDSMLELPHLLRAQQFITSVVICNGVTYLCC
jgi:hypothetical protein